MFLEKNCRCDMAVKKANFGVQRRLVYDPMLVLYSSYEYIPRRYIVLLLKGFISPTRSPGFPSLPRETTVLCTTRPQAESSRPYNSYRCSTPRM